MSNDYAHEVVRYPGHVVEAEIQAEIYRRLTNAGFDVRLEVPWEAPGRKRTGTSRLDVVVFHEFAPVVALEVKASIERIRCSSRHRVKQKSQHTWLTNGGLNVHDVACPDEAMRKVLEHIDMATYLSDKKVSERYDVSRATVWRWVRDGSFPEPIKLTAGCTRWKESDLEEWESSKGAA